MSDSTNNNKGFFKVKNVTKIEDLVKGFVNEISQSDLCVQNDDAIVQFDFIAAADTAKTILSPGVYSLAPTADGATTENLTLKKRNLLESLVNTSIIMKEAHQFFSKLDIYRQLNRQPKRGVLLYSKPGLGKTSAIEKICSNMIEEEAGTVVLVWPTSRVTADDVYSFLNAKIEYDSKCSRLILIIEDIGGQERHGEHGLNSVESGLLNLLDGVGMTFRLPTFIIATTNHPENLLSSLADRPGRFDLMIELVPPSAAERVTLMEFIAKRHLSQDEMDALNIKGVEEFSIAHFEEIVVRSLLHDKSYKEVILELIRHTKKFKKNFEERSHPIGL